MKTIAYFNIPAYGHIGPSLPVVEKLLDQGARVVYYVSEAYRDAVAATGAEVRVVPNFMSLPEGSLPRDVLNAAYSAVEQTLYGMPFFREEMAKEDVGLILHDHACLWGRCVAQVEGIPSIRTCSILMNCDPLMPRIKLPARALLRLFRQWPELLRFRKLTSQLQREFGLPRIGVADALKTRGDLNILFTSPEYFTESSGFDESYRLVGASLSDRATATLPLPERGDRPLVYISLGTLFNQRTDFYQICQEAFAGEDVFVVISVGKGTDPASLAPWPENFHAASSVPQLDVLKQASVFISQAGGCSVNESLVHGVPLVVWPQHYEHVFNAERVVLNGAGVRLSDEDITPPGLREAALRILGDPNYQTQAAHLGKTLIDAGGARRAAEEILAFQQRHEAAAD